MKIGDFNKTDRKRRVSSIRIKKDEIVVRFNGGPIVYINIEQDYGESWLNIETLSERRDKIKKWKESGGNKNLIEQMIKLIPNDIERLKEKYSGDTFSEAMNLMQRNLFDSQKQKLEL